MTKDATKIAMTADLHETVRALQKNGADLGLEIDAQGARFYNRKFRDARSAYLGLHEAAAWLDGFTRGYTEYAGEADVRADAPPSRSGRLAPEIEKHIRTGGNYIEGLRLIRSVTGATLEQAKAIYKQIAGRTPRERA